MSVLGSGPVVGDETLIRFAAELAAAAIPETPDSDRPIADRGENRSRASSYSLWRHVPSARRGPKARCGTDGIVSVRAARGQIHFHETPRKRAGLVICLPPQVPLRTMSDLRSALTAVAALPGRLADEEPDGPEASDGRRDLALATLAAAIAADAPDAVRADCRLPTDATRLQIVCERADGSRSFWMGGDGASAHGVGRTSDALLARVRALVDPRLHCGHSRDSRTTSLIVGPTASEPIPRLDPIEAARFIREIGPGPHLLPPRP